MVKQFTAPAESASNGMYRTLREALDFVREDGNIDYFVVYMLDRFIRDELTLFQTYAELQMMGTQLVSASETIDNSPAGLMNMGMLGVVNAYRSRNDAIKVKDGMRKKAELGGTPGRAKLGYLNKQRMDGRNSIRTVELDPTRSLHIQFAFQAFATSEWSLTALADELYERGLRSNPGGRAPGKVGRSSLHRILRDPYYKGVVVFKGIEYEGTHARLVPDVLFDRVQQILDARSKGRDNSWRHRHYVKGSVFCAACDERLLFTKITGNGGQYDYFICAGRHRGSGCALPYLPAEWVEEQVTAVHRKEVKRFADRVAAVEPQLAEQFGLLTEHQRKYADKCRGEIKRLEDKRHRLVSDHLARPNAIPLDVLEAEQANLSASLASARARLATAEADLGKAERGLEKARALLYELPEGYEKVDPETRRRLNQAVFKRVLVGVEGIERTEFTDEFDGLLDDKLPSLLEKIVIEPKSSSFGPGANSGPLVPPAGFEPAPRGLKGRRSNQLSYRGVRPMVIRSGKLGQPLLGRRGLGVGAAGDAARPASGVTGLDRAAQGTCHRGRILGPEDRAGRHHRVAAQLHRQRRIRCRANAGVEDDRDRGPFGDDRDVVGVADAGAGADRRAERHHHGAARLLEATGEDRVVVGVGEDGEALADQDLGGVEQLDRIRVEGAVVADYLELDPVGLEGLAGEAGGADRVAGGEAASGVGQGEETKAVEYVEHRALRRGVDAAQRDGDDLRTGGDQRLLHLLQRAEAAGARDQPRRPLASPQLPGLGTALDRGKHLDAVALGERRRVPLGAWHDLAVERHGDAATLALGAALAHRVG